MTYPGIALAVLVGVGLGTLLYYFLSEDSNTHDYAPYNYTPTPAPGSPPQRPNQNKRPNSSRNNQSNYQKSSIHGSRRRIKNGRLDETCVICTEQVANSGIYLQPCGHVFHTTCIRTWREQGTPSTCHLCPICREPFKGAI